MLEGERIKIDYILRAFQLPDVQAFQPPSLLAFQHR